MILGAYLLIPAVHLLHARAWSAEAAWPLAEPVALSWLLLTVTVVGGRVVYLVWAQSLYLAMVWFVKLITDPLTDLIAYSPRYLRRA